MPPFDVQKHPFDESLSRVIQNEIAAAQSMLGKSVPCSVEEVGKNGTIVKVKLEIKQPNLTFPIIECAVYGPEFVRWPIKKGDKGVMMCADFSIGRMTGLGTAVASMQSRGNFADGVFVPVGNMDFSKLKDGEDKKVVIYGPDGVIIKTEKGDTGRVDVSDKGVTIFISGDETTGSYLKMSSAGFQFFVDGAMKFVIDAGGARYVGNPIPTGGNFGINVTDTGTTIDGINFLPHKHDGVTTGGGTSGPVDTPP